jgi:ABC-type methionine transport system permease subunit
VLGERLCGQQRTTGVLRRGGFGECAWKEASWTQRTMFLVVVVIVVVVVVVVGRERTRRGCVGGQFGSLL